MYALRNVGSGATAGAPDPFTKTEADNSAISDARVSAETRPSYTGAMAISGKLVAQLAVESNTTLATGSFDVHLLWNAHAGGAGGKDLQYKGNLVKIGTIAWTAGASQIASTDDVNPSFYPCVPVWTGTSDYAAICTALGESGGAVIDNVLHLACLGRADQLIVKPASFSGAGVTAVVLGAASDC